MEIRTITSRKPYVLHTIHVALHLSYVAIHEVQLWNEVSISIAACHNMPTGGTSFSYTADL